jgi:hypothetical protein
LDREVGAKLLGEPLPAEEVAQLGRGCSSGGAGSSADAGGRGGGDQVGHFIGDLVQQAARREAGPVVVIISRWR